MKQRILAIDDDQDIRDFISIILGDDHEIVPATSGSEAARILSSQPAFDLILLDVIMPEKDGYEVIADLKELPQAQGVPVIFLTGRSSMEEEQKGLSLGAVDYIAKPISAPILIARVQTHLALKAAQDDLKAQNRILEDRVAERTQELALTQDVTILSLASLAETRDNETGNHIRRTQAYVRKLAEALAEKGHYADELTDETIKLLEKSAPLHDIGKVGVPDNVLLKPGKLTDEEHDIIKLHTTHGRTALESAEAVLGTTSFLRHAKEIAYSHHEKWDGSGYPEGLKGESIPLSARLMAVADVYDALLCKRVYKPALPHERVVEIIVEGRGSFFDPVIVDTFLECGEAFQEIAARLSDD